MKDFKDVSKRPVQASIHQPVHYFHETQLISPDGQRQSGALEHLQQALEKNEPVAIEMDSFTPERQAAFHQLALEMFARAENATSHPTTSKIYFGTNRTM